jgi:hypothetical protein
MIAIVIDLIVKSVLTTYVRSANVNEIAAFILVFISAWTAVVPASKAYWLNVGPHVDETLNPNKYEEDK